jgi:hypothetical protein
MKGRGADLFFGEEPSPLAQEDGESEAPAVGPEEPSVETDHEDLGLAREVQDIPAPDVVPPAKRQPRSRARASSTTPQASDAAPDDVDVIEEIRRIVKMPGREVSYVRLTPEEKARLSDVIYTYKRQGQKTTETEINRIALNYLLDDYFEHGEQSVLARVLAALAA